ncbi:unnamed protein product [Ambrosiozyma monospora]|uniref:Unnamed protein product n=1 Tax=Ambrosiozyma monospora TaxID=43982 RepID=A0ACB5TBA0_AMBMO|nr:unnamed protein product [Ambrosiozyma monospora]
MKLFQNASEIHLSKTPKLHEQGLVLDKFMLCARITKFTLIMDKEPNLVQIDFLKTLTNLKKLYINVQDHLIERDQQIHVFDFIRSSTSLRQLKISVLAHFPNQIPDWLVSLIAQLDYEMRGRLDINVEFINGIPVDRAEYFKSSMKFRKIEHLFTDVHLAFNLKNNLYLDSFGGDKSKLRKLQLVLSSSQEIEWEFDLVCPTLRYLQISQKQEALVRFNFSGVSNIKLLNLSQCVISSDTFSDKFCLPNLKDLQLNNCQFELPDNNEDGSDPIGLHLPESISFLKITHFVKQPFPHFSNTENLVNLLEVQIAAIRIIHQIRRIST